jgi:hypothetical protein
MKGLFAVHESGFGTERTYRDGLPFVRFWGEADVLRLLALPASVVNDPKRTYRGLKSRSAAALRRIPCGRK